MGFGHIVIVVLVTLVIAPLVKYRTSDGCGSPRGHWVNER